MDGDEWGPARLVMMEGVPGAGKSTLADRLAQELRDFGRGVDLFPEEELFTRPEFAAVAQAFRDKASPTPDLFLLAFAAVISSAARERMWSVYDWNCAGMASDLPWAVADPGRLRDLLRDVYDLAAVLEPVVLWLVADVEEAVRRAAAERGKSWVRRYSRIAAEHGAPAGPPLQRIAAYERAEARSVQHDLEGLAAAGWPIRRIDANDTLDGMLTQAHRALTRP